ncbi:Thioredoxin-like fold protein [Niveomyces insectorum RCEF 264]|uniref:Thioredoxin-like fold protein n=1 Tax=Niveomyces insectorum RCEF 264 TaxID=1081102 RepID=A0A168AF72_9HYPO|nr:Thioredoxin-like fold protein [Niveomyces insectorum RCEF 264]
MTEAPQIILYHYAYSPFARRVQWYLLLRGLPYSECLQPPTMPRPDLRLLGVRHRRIPVLAIGRDVYMDSRLILRKLEQIASPSLPPLLGITAAAGLSSSSSSSSPELLALERLLDVLTVDGTLFANAGRLIPDSVPLLKDPAFHKDRADFMGAPMFPHHPLGDRARNSNHVSPSSSDLRRAEALVEIRHAAALLETTMLADGRDWILRTAAPSLADIEAIWPFHWLASMPGAFDVGGGGGGGSSSRSAASAPQAGLSREQYPRLLAWVDRFNTVLRAARKAREPPVPRLDGPTAAAAVWAAPFHEVQPDSNGDNDYVDPSDPVARVSGLRAGQRVVVWPTDTGASGRDVGRLVRLTADEVVLAIGPSEDRSSSSSSSGTSSLSIHLHAPRHGFRVRPFDEADEAKL